MNVKKGLFKLQLLEKKKKNFPRKKMVLYAEDMFIMEKKKSKLYKEKKVIFWRIPSLDPPPHMSLDF